MVDVVHEPFEHIYDPSTPAEQWYINDHTFVQGPDKKWHMFGITGREPVGPGSEVFFDHAVADDPWGPWTQQKPVMHADESHYGEKRVWAPHVIEHEGRYLMFYCGAKDSHVNVYDIHLAFSTDLYHWERDRENNPIVSDGVHGRDPMVFRHGDEWILYYTATSSPDGGNHIVAAVTSKDLVNWSDRKVVFTHSKVGGWGGPTESPFVIERNGKYYLFICTNRPYSSTAVYESDTPLHWTEDQQIALIPSHAAEVIQLPGDEWLVSRCGWGQGGLYLARMHFKEKTKAESKAPAESAGRAH